MSEKKYYTYRYAYPQGFVDDNGNDLSGVVFYVGKGQGNRIDAHENEARSACPCVKCGVVRSVWAKGLQVDKAKMLEFDSENDALAHESQCIVVDYAGIYLVNIHRNRHRTTSRSLDLFTSSTKRWNSLSKFNNLIEACQRGDLQPSDNFLLAAWAAYVRDRLYVPEMWDKPAEEQMDAFLADVPSDIMQQMGGGEDFKFWMLLFNEPDTNFTWY